MECKLTPDGKESKLYKKLRNTYSEATANAIFNTLSSDKFKEQTGIDWVEFIETGKRTDFAGKVKNVANEAKEEFNSDKEPVVEVEKKEVEALTKEEVENKVTETISKALVLINKDDSTEEEFREVYEEILQSKPLLTKAQKKRLKMSNGSKLPFKNKFAERRTYQHLMLKEFEKMFKEVETPLDVLRNLSAFGKLSKKEREESDDFVKGGFVWDPFSDKDALFEMSLKEEGEVEKKETQIQLWRADSTDGNFITPTKKREQLEYGLGVYFGDNKDTVVNNYQHSGNNLHERIININNNEIFDLDNFDKEISNKVADALDSLGGIFKFLGKQFRTNPRLVFKNLENQIDGDSWIKAQNTINNVLKENGIKVIKVKPIDYQGNFYTIIDNSIILKKQRYNPFNDDDAVFEMSLREEGESYQERRAALTYKNIDEVRNIAMSAVGNKVDLFESDDLNSDLLNEEAFNLFLSYFKQASTSVGPKQFTEGFREYVRNLQGETEQTEGVKTEPLPTTESLMQSNRLKYNCK